MTIAVAIKKGDEIVLAADSFTFFGDQRAGEPNVPTRKVIQLGASLIAISGWSLYGTILEDYGARHPLAANAGSLEIFRYFLKFWKGLRTTYPFVNDQSGKDDDPTPFVDLDSEFLLANRRGIFKVCSNMGVVEFTQYATTGSGQDYAMGTLFTLYDTPLDAETLARRAIETATHFDSNCGGAPLICKIKLDPRFRPKAAKPQPGQGKFPLTPELPEKTKRERR